MLIHSIIVGLCLVCIALTIERILLHRQRSRLRRIELEFRFHRLRDELQSMAVDETLDSRSHVYRFLMTLINLGIKNGGTFRLSELFQIRRQDEVCVPKPKSDFLVDIKLYNNEVQHFAGRCFDEFSRMLLLNDPIFGAGHVLSSALRFSWRKVLDQVSREKEVPLLENMFPHSAETLRTAAEYRALGADLCAA